jgi:hypothetical protein
MPSFPVRDNAIRRTEDGSRAGSAELPMSRSSPAIVSSFAWSRVARPPIVRRLSAVVLAGLVGSCGAAPDKFAPACPDISFLNDAADLTRFRASGRDVTDMVLDGKLTNIGGGCARNPDKPDIVTTTMRVSMDLTRGPAAQGRTAQVPFFVAATEGDRVLDEQDYAINANFPPNIDHGVYTSGDIVLNFPVSRTKSAAAYHVFVGFRLSPDELAANRARGAR